MRISEAKECIRELFNHTREVTALISERGVGKTSAYQQCAEELGVGYMALYAAALEGPDFMGLPDRESDTGITRYLAPQFLPTQKAVAAGLFPERGIIVFEEINRVPSDTVSVLYPLLLEGRINNHALVPGWRIGVTMNPDKLNYSVNALDDALIDRFISIEITPHMDDYTDFSLKNGSHDQVLAYLSACPDMLLVTKESADSNPLAKNPTPRGWTKVQEIMNKCDLKEELQELLIAGIVGPEAAAAFFGFIKTNDVAIPGALATLTGFESQKELYDLLLKDSRVDILNIVLKKIVRELKLCEPHMENLNSLLTYLPEEFAIMLFKYFVTQRVEDFDYISENLPVFDKVSDSIIDFIAS
jgi:hypothetical protein